MAGAKQETTQQAATIPGLTFVNGLKTRKSCYTPELMMQVFVGKIIKNSGGRRVRYCGK